MDWFRRISLCLLAVGVGCSKVSPGRGEAGPENPGPGAALGQKIFLSRCFVCHGTNGNGQGPAATGLGANPRDFTDPAWQRSATDDRIRKVIRKGGEAVGENAAMPPNPDLQNDQVEGLLAFIRSLARS
ncbi:MAG TPA: c-type cytochrome [Chthoniobacterales bacterium]